MNFFLFPCICILFFTSVLRSQCIVTGTINGSANLCQNAGSPKITFSASNGTSPYTFTYSVNGGSALAITTVSGSSVNLSVPTTTPGTFVYSLLGVTDNTGCTQPQTGVATVTVNANTSINLTSAAGTNAQTVCINSPLTTITYVIGGATSASLAGTLPSGVTGAYSGGLFTISGVPVVAGTFTYTINASGSCNNALVTGSIRVNNIAPGTVATNQVLCSGGDPATLTSSVAATGSGTVAYQWQSSTNDCNSGFNDISGATSATYNPPAGLTATTYYRRMAISTFNGVACTAVTNCITITISDLTAGSITTDQTVCNGGDPDVFNGTPATSSGVITYQWQKNTAGCSGTFSNIPGATAAVYDAPAGLTATTYYRRVATSIVNGVSCSVNSNCVMVTVNGVTPGTVTGTQTVCSGSSLLLAESVAATGTGLLSYQWQSSITGCTGVFTDISGAVSATYTVPAGLPVTTNYRRIVNSTVGGVVCTSTSNCVTVSANTLSPGTVAGGQTVCSGGDPAAFTVAVAAAGSGTVTYQWQKSTTDCTTGFTDISGATAGTYDPPAGLLVTTYYRRIASSTLNGITCSLPANCLIVTVHDLSPGSIGSDQTICNGVIPAGFTSVAATSSGIVSYQWQKNTTGCAGTFTNISGATADIYNETSGLPVTTYYRRVATSAMNGVTCSLNSNCITVTVNNVSAGTVAGTQTICSGTGLTLTESATATGTGTLTYQWQSNTTGCSSAFADIAGATSKTYAIAAGLNSTAYFRRVVNSTVNGVVCTAVSACLTVTVNNITPGTITGSQTFCNATNSGTFASTEAATGSGTVTYQWQKSTTDCNTGFSDINGASSAAFTPPAGLAVATYYRRMATSTLGGFACSAYSNCQAVLINNVTAGTISGTQTICAGDNPAGFTSSASGTATGTLSYQWQSSTVDCTTGFGDITGAASAAYNVPAGLTLTTYYRRITGSVLNGLTCQAISNCVTITVTPVPVITSAGSASICSGTALSIPLTGNMPASYTWIATANANVTGESTVTETTGTINNTLYNSTSTVQTVIYTVIPTSTANGCAGAAQTVTVTVNPTPVVTIATNYCYGGGKVQLTANSNTSSTFLWNTGETTQSILVDLAGGYWVKATGAGGCSATTYVQVANELVTNGDFSAGNTGFTNEYDSVAKTVANGLLPETRYTVNNNPTFNHANFWGRDHTTGSGNFLIVNGAGKSTTVVWQETSPVKPNTKYYFAAWAMSLNSVTPYAQLQFAINGVPLGTTAVLAARPNNNNPPYNWVRFYGTWNSGTATTAQISIVDLQTAKGGNDFGLDDISFGTLDPIPFAVDGSSEVCAGSTLTLMPNIKGGSGTITYSWTGPNGFKSTVSNPTIKNVTAANGGVYTLTLKDVYGCPMSGNYTVKINPNPALGFSKTDVKCNGVSTGTVTLTVTSGTAPFTYTWSNGATAKDLTGLAAGTYSINVTDSVGCTATGSVTITQPAALTATQVVTNVKCNGGLTGAVVIKPSGGLAPYTITPEQTGLAAGSYVFTVTDSNKCSITVPVTITQPAAISVTKVVTNIKCNGVATGSVNITVTGGTAPYTYLWSNGAKTQDVAGLVAGSYSVAVTDANSCTDLQSFTITQPAALTAGKVITNVKCNGGSTGSVVITPAGGIAPYTITPAQTNLAAGNYTFTVTDSNNCSVTVPVTVTQPAALNAAKVITNVKCNGGSTGSVVITPSGGTAPYVITPAQTNLVAGNYTFTVTDSNNCTLSVAVIITQPAVLTAPTAITNVKCNGGSTGSVVVTPSGGTAPYSIVPAQTTGLAAGSYTYTVTDANNCSVSVPVTITQPAAIGFAKVVTNVKCNGGSTGSVSITASGGVAPYAITPAQTGLAAGNYTFTITDANSCTVSVPVTITQPSVLTAAKIITNVKCNGGSTGSVLITPSGGVAPYVITPAQTTNLAAGNYTFTVTDSNNCTVTVPVAITQPAVLTATKAITNVKCNGGSTGSVVITPSGGTAPYTIMPAQTNLAAGNYTFIITDSNNCTSSVPVTITQPALLTANAAVTNVKCNGGSTGSVVITPSGGTAPYTIKPAQINLAAGNYIFTVVDANDCSVTVPVTITQPAVMTASTIVTNVKCYGASTGALDLIVTGGTAPYTYAWSNGVKTEDLTGLAAGSYSVTVTDANNCTVTQSVTITQPAALSAGKVITNVKCYGGSTGSVVITPSGGVAPYTITPAQTGLAAGNYTFTVTDSNNCTVTVPVSITQPSALAFTTIVTNVKCNGGSTGSVVITPSGGTAPYTITPAQTNLAAGNYTFTITDANNCAVSVPVTITQPAALTAIEVITNVKCYGGSTGSVVITPSGGKAPYVITPAQTGLAAGNYTFTVTDANNCSTTVPVTITQPAALSAGKVITHVKCYGGLTGSVVITPSGGVAPYTITPAQANLAAGNYTFTVTDSNNCTVTVPVTITQPAALAATKAITNVTCNGGSTGSVVITPSGGAAPYIITPAQTNLAAGNYTFTVTDVNNCTLLVPVTVTQPAVLTATTAVTNVKCNGASAGSVVITHQVVLHHIRSRLHKQILLLAIIFSQLWMRTTVPLQYQSRLRSQLPF